MTRRDSLRLLAGSGLAAHGLSQSSPDLAVIHRIKAEAFQNSKVMDHLGMLTDVHGPRLTGSPQFRAAAEWAISRLEEFGIPDAKLESWGPFGKEWALQRFSAHLIQPSYQPLVGYPLAWSPGTNGVVAGEPLYVPVSGDADPDRRDDLFEAWKRRHQGKLKGRIVLMEEIKPLSPQAEPLSRRYSDKDLADEAAAPRPYALPSFDPNRPRVPKGEEADFSDSAPLSMTEAVWQESQRFRDRVTRFLVEQGVALRLRRSYNGRAGTVFGESAGSFRTGEPAVPTVALTVEHYDRLVRLLDRRVPTRIEVEIRVQPGDRPAEGLNLVAEMPGGRKRDEFVMLGAHLDSWVGATGATDNAAGCAVMLEAMRILKAVGAPLDRSLRLALWGGEEQGYFGSYAYVRDHFADPKTMRPKPEHARLAAYYNLDNGGGKIRGVYLQGNDMARPVLASMLAPFRDLGVSTVTIRNTGGTDHEPFDQVGLPAYQFIQDPLEYSTRTHHSNMDTYDHVRRGDLMQAAAVVAAVAYQTAMLPERLPRKPV